MKQKRNKIVEFSKWILILSAIWTVYVTHVFFFFLFTGHKTTYLNLVLKYSYAELATAVGFYFWKAKAENTLKLKIQEWKEKKKLDVVDTESESE